MKNINIFRYKVNYWDAIEGDKIDYGFAFGKNMGDAVNRICSIYTPPKDEKGGVIDMHIYEIDSYDVGILTDETIDETRKEEK